MLKHLVHTLACLACLAVAACSGSDRFKIEGEVAGNPTMNLYVKYYGNGAVRQGVTPVQGGKFSFVTSSAQPAVVEIMDNEQHVLGRVYAKNGDKFKLKLDRRNPNLIEVAGTETNQQWAAVLREHSDSLFAGTPATVNGIVEEYSAQNPGSLVAALMFATLYDISINPLRADSVMRSIGSTPETQDILSPMALALNRYDEAEVDVKLDTLAYRLPVKDSLQYWLARDNVATLLVLTNEKSHRRDSIVPAIKKIYDKKKKGLKIVDLMLAVDTAAWKRSIRQDSAKWEQGWMPGGLYARGIDRLVIADLPTCLVIDSVGTPVYQGPDLEQAEAEANLLLGK